MQPYIFPYLGYFQLINAVDKFVFYDDVNFIKGGWISRNHILLNGNKNLFTIPLKGASSFQTINETLIHSELYFKWKKKFLKSLEQSYKKAPYFDIVYSMILKNIDIKHTSIADLCINNIEQVANYLELKTVFELSSEKYSNTKNMERTERLISICKLNNATTYINPIGGKKLYHKDIFKKKNINLFFIQNQLPVYCQFNNDFIAGLSIIDVLMFNSKENVKKMLNQYTLD